MAIIVVSNLKGGTGKTITAGELATVWARGGMKILLVDLDAQANLSSWLGPAEADATIADVLEGTFPIQQAIVPTETPNLMLLMGSTALEGAATHVNKTSRSPFVVLRHLLDTVRDQYDHVIIDCAPALALMTASALITADILLVPVTPGHWAVDGLSKILSTIDELVAERLREPLQAVRVIVTLVDGTAGAAHKRRAEAIDNIENVVVCRTRIPKSPLIEAAVEQRTSIQLYRPTSSGAKAYVALAEELLA